jgi:flagellin
MLSINTNASAMAALASLNATTAQLNTTQNAVSTGQSVSQASDNPAIYAISQSINASIAGLTAVSANLAFGQSTISVAAAAGQQISSQLANLTNTITQGQQQGLSTTTIDNQINSILTNIDQFANSATFQNVNLLNGTGGTLNVVENAQGNTINVTNQNATVAGLGLTGLTTASGGQQLAFDSTFAPANGDSIMLADSNFGSFGDLTSYAAGTGFSAAAAGYSLTAGGAPTGTPPTSVATATVFEFDDGSAPPTSTPQAIYDATTNQVVAKVNVVSISLNSNASPLSDIGSLLSAMQQSGFGAQQNSDGTVDVTGAAAFTAAEQTAAVSVVSGGATMTSVTGATMAIDTVNNAVTAMNGKSAALGEAQQQITGLQTFTSSLQSSLQSGLGALTDADMAAESAKLTSLQTKQQLAIATLTTANQQPQVLLKLFGA